ncbi:MAG: ATPase [Ruminococcaceae bacterium]|nr:ATPase [Oscillospiraceae bacterium]
MIVPMKKVSLIIMGNQKTETLKKLRKLGIMHIEISEGYGEKLQHLKEQVTLLETALFLVGKTKDATPKNVTTTEALDAAREILSLSEEKKAVLAEQGALNAELARLQGWGEIDPHALQDLVQNGVEAALYELSPARYDSLGDCVQTVCISRTKAAVKCLLIQTGASGEEEVIASIADCRVPLPQTSTFEIRGRLAALDARITAVDQALAAYADYADGIKKAVAALEKEIEFEVYATGMADEDLSERNTTAVVACFKGYVEAENVENIKQAAHEHAWGLLVEDPTEEDNVPTKLKNNKFVSLIYPLTDFLGTVPGYFEHDISAWFLLFILIFFGIIFGDGGYGLFISAIAAVPIVRSLINKKAPSPLFLLVGLFGLSTMLWGLLTCTWFGLSPEILPTWLTKLSIPVISNVYADKIWYPFWVPAGGAGLTTQQNLQILCFTLALIQLCVAHVKGAIHCGRSIKMLGDIGSVLQLLGIYYVVLSLVVNPQVFSLGLVIGGIPVGTAAIALVGVGFVLSFVFANYEGNLLKSVLASLKDIVSVLLGVVNVFSDIVSYIRLWAVGLAGAAISTTVNELASPMLGNFLFMIFAIIVLVFGHGLNMILNVLSVIVHGIRLNTLEFSSHLNMSWSGHKFKPFEEKTDCKGESL